MKSENDKSEKSKGGLYSGINISRKAADILVVLSAGALSLCLFAAILLG